MNQNLSSTEIINQNISIISTNKAGNNLYKLKMNSDKYYIFCISVIKSPKPFIIIQVITAMGVIIKDNKLLINTEPRTIHFDLLKYEMSKTP